MKAKGFCLLCQRLAGKCDHTKPCKDCKKMWINCICKTKEKSDVKNNALQKGE